MILSNDKSHLVIVNKSKIQVQHWKVVVIIIHTQLILVLSEKQI